MTATNTTTTTTTTTNDGVGKGKGKGTATATERGSLVVIVDFQNDFILEDGALPVFKSDSHDKENLPRRRSKALIRRFNTYLSELDPNSTSAVLFTFDAHDEKSYAQTREAKLFPPHCIRGTKGYELALDASLIPSQIRTYKLEKGVFDTWEEPVTVLPFDTSSSRQEVNWIPFVSLIVFSVPLLSSC